MTPARIKHYQSLGWEFITDEWVNHHNGDPETDYYIKSPRLSEQVAVHPRHDSATNRWSLPWEWMTERQLLARETRAYVEERLGEDTWGGNLRALKDAAIKALLKDPDAKTITIKVKLK